MIRQRLYISEYDIVVYAYYAKTGYYAEEIVEKMLEVGCRGYKIGQAYVNLSSNQLDTGLTYYNPFTKSGVMVVALTSTAAEFFNSLLHELGHLVAYIAKAEHLSFTGEDIAYLEGELARDIYPKVKDLLCDCCRRKEEY